jgi:hypothetical protein
VSVILEIIGGLTAFVSFLVIVLMVLIKKKIFQRCSRREPFRNDLELEDFNEEQSKPSFVKISLY